MSDSTRPSRAGHSRAAESLDACACFNVRSAARAVTALYDEALDGTGLRMTQLAILVAVARSREPLMQEVAAELDIDPSTMTRTIGPLESAGYLEIRSGDDRRVKRLALTVAGRAQLADCGKRWESAQTELRERIGPARFERMIKDLAATRRALTAE